MSRKLAAPRVESGQPASQTGLVEWCPFVQSALAGRAAFKAGLETNAKIVHPSLAHESKKVFPDTMLATKGRHGMKTWDTWYRLCRS